MPDYVHDHSEPANPIEDAADVAMDGFVTLVENRGGTVEEVVLLAHLSDIEPTGITSARGIQSDEELLQFLITAATGTARQMGLSLQMTIRT